MELGERMTTRNPQAAMTPAQLARREFKSSLPRKIRNHRLTAMEALGETFTLIDRFRGMATQRGLDVSTVQAALVYSLPETAPEVFEHTEPLPMPSRIGGFCEAIVGLDRPLFLGLLFVQEDPDAVGTKYQRVLFCAQFMAGPEVEGRLLAARKRQQMGVN